MSRRESCDSRQDNSGILPRRNFPVSGPVCWGLAFRRPTGCFVGVIGVQLHVWVGNQTDSHPVGAVRLRCEHSVQRLLYVGGRPPFHLINCEGFWLRMTSVVSWSLLRKHLRPRATSRSWSPFWQRVLGSASTSTQGRRPQETREGLMCVGTDVLGLSLTRPSP